MLTMTQVNSIRNSFFCEGLSISEISRIYSCDRKTVRKYIAMDNFNPKPKLLLHQRKAKLDPFKPLIDSWLYEDKMHRVKQRHTAKRIFIRLSNEIPNFNASYRTVANYVRHKKCLIYKQQQGYLPLVHTPAEAQVDFGTADFYENGRLVEGHYLVISFPYSNAGYVQMFKGENLECLMQGMRNVFEFIGGVPNEIWFDNPSTIVSTVLRGGKRVLTEGFSRFKEHYGFSAHFCNVKSGNEKGSVENKVGYIRHNFFVPIPKITSLADYNSKLLTDMVSDQKREHYRFDASIDELHKKDLENLLSLPSEHYDCCSYSTLKTNGYGFFKLDDNSHTYSTSPAYALKCITVKRTAYEVIPLTAANKPIVIHKRLYGKEKQECMDWLPYLTQLSRKPAALRYTGIYDMLPKNLKTALDSMEHNEKGSLLKSLAELTARDNFESAIKAVMKAVENGTTDSASINALDIHLKQRPLKEVMDLHKITLPELPGIRFNAMVYDSLLVEAGDKR